MTCREKLKLEHPECVNPDFVGGCRDCPSTYGYLGDSDKCDGGRRDEVCRKCWDREIPGTQPVEQDDDQLKPCPFCGGEPEMVRKPVKTNGTWCDAVYVRCKDCDSRTGRILYTAKAHPNGEEYAEAEKLWNRRV